MFAVLRETVTVRFKKLHASTCTHCGPCGPSQTHKKCCFRKLRRPRGPKTIAPLANHVDSGDSEDIIGHTERGLLHQGRSMPKVTIKTGPTTDKVIVFPSIQSMSLFFWYLAKS